MLRLLSRKSFWVALLIVNISIFAIIVACGRSDLTIATIFALTEYAIVLFSFRFLKIGLISVPFYFVSFSFLVNCGHPLLMLFGFTDKIRYSMMPDYTSLEMYIKSMIIVVFVHFFVALGTILVNKNYKSDRQTSNGIVPSSQAYCLRLIAVVLLTISIPFRFFNDFTKIVAFLNGGYDASLVSVESGLVSTISKLFDVGVFALVISYANKKANALLISAVYSFIVLVVMLTGNRGYGVCCLLTLFLIIMNVLKVKIRIKTAILIIIIGYLLASLLITISDYRLSGDYESLPKRYIENVFGGGVIVKVLDEFGTSLVSVSHSIEAFPSTHPYTYGTNYLRSLMLVFPNVFGFVDTIAKSETFSVYFIIKHEIGGSYIGEMYYAFGYFAPFFGLFIGLFIGAINNSINKNLSTTNLLKLLVLFTFVPPLIWWIRDYFWCFVRYSSWTIIPIAIVSSLLAKKSVWHKRLLSKTDLNII